MGRRVGPSGALWARGGMIVRLRARRCAQPAPCGGGPGLYHPGCARSAARKTGRRAARLGLCEGEVRGRAQVGRWEHGARSAPPSHVAARRQAGPRERPLPEGHFPRPPLHTQIAGPQSQGRTPSHATGATPLGMRLQTLLRVGGRRRARKREGGEAEQQGDAKALKTRPLSRHLGQIWARSAEKQRTLAKKRLGKYVSGCARVQPDQIRRHRNRAWTVR